MNEYDYIKDKRGRKLIAITTGGTAGHIFPAEVLAYKLGSITEAQELGEVKGDHKYDLLFVGDKKVAAFAESLPNLKRFSVPAKGFSHVKGWRGHLQNAQTALYLSMGCLKVLASFILRRPAAVVGFGSYASLPALAAAWLLRIPYMLHEQNAVLGRANRLFMKNAKRMALSFADTKHVEVETIEVQKVQDISLEDDDYEEEEESPQKIRHSGNPVRRGFEIAEYETPNQSDDFRILITGGSQGAQFFGDVIPQALALLPEKYKKRLRVIQQVRGEQIRTAKDLYAKEGIDAALSPFLSNMPTLLKDSHLFIGRAGASTIAELLAVGRPSILIPLPNSVDDHQQANAEFLQGRKGCWLMQQADAKAETLSNKIKDLMDKPEALEKAAARAAGSFSGNPGEILKNILMEFMEEAR